MLRYNSKIYCLSFASDSNVLQECEEAPHACLLEGYCSSDITNAPASITLDDAIGAGVSKVGLPYEHKCMGSVIRQSRPPNSRGINFRQRSGSVDDPG